jgi:hypothetical protein
LYSGALQRAQNDAQFNYQANDAALRNEYGQQLAALSAQRATAANTRNDAKSSAYWDFINSQIAARAAGYGVTDPAAEAAAAAAAAGGAQAAGYGTVAGPDGTPLNAGLVAQASQVGGAAAPSAPYQAPTYDPYAYKRLLGIVDTTPKSPYRGPTARGTGGARFGG